MTADGTCPKHRRERNRRKEHLRLTSAERGYDHEWRVCRAQYLEEHPVCESDEGCDLPATEVHHTERLVDGGAKCDKKKLQALCGKHHDRLGGSGGRG